MGMAAERDFVEHMTWDAVARRIDSGAAAILPVGAGAKQHGLHMPLNTDRIQAEYLAGRLAAEIDALIWPTLNYGHYPAFVAYAGSTSLSAATFEAVVGEIACDILRHGCRALFVIDTGISTRAAIAQALARPGLDHALHLKIHDGPRYRRAADQIAEQSLGSHADELETSLMLAIAPELVDMPRAEASRWIDHVMPGPLTPTDETSPNYSRSGSFGDPTPATGTEGEVLLAAMIDDITVQAREFLTQLARTSPRARGAAS
jgi:creatinine amidohydrolase